MKQLTCEMCGSTDLMKQDGVFVCQTCGTKYSVEEAKKMMIDGTVDVTGSTVKIDTSSELANLYQIARRAKDDNNGENAAKYYDMILIRDPTSWEASFYVVYFKATECKIAQIESAAVSIYNCIDTVFRLINENINDKAAQKEAYTEVSTRVMTIASLLHSGAENHYNSIDYQIRHNYGQEFRDRARACIHCLYCLGDHLEKFFGDDAEANTLALTAWKRGIAVHKKLVLKDIDKKDVALYVGKIQKYDDSYVEPAAEGCYIATAVYGSYDCPEVWTLRRYRDYTLAETWHGRAFIRTYYAISPTLVKWFGKTDWFKKMWQEKLDRMVEKLNAEGVENTPYIDKEW